MADPTAKPATPPPTAAIAPERLAALRARLDAATPGPWHGWSVTAVRHEDMQLIAHAPTDIATLLAAAEALQAEVERATGTLAKLERLLRAGWYVSRPQEDGDDWCLDLGRVESHGATLAEAVAAAPEPP